MPASEASARVGGSFSPGRELARLDGGHEAVDQLLGDGRVAVAIEIGQVQLVRHCCIAHRVDTTPVLAKQQLVLQKRSQCPTTPLIHLTSRCGWLVPRTRASSSPSPPWTPRPCRRERSWSPSPRAGSWPRCRSPAAPPSPTRSTAPLALVQMLELRAQQLRASSMATPGRGLAHHGRAATARRCAPTRPSLLLGSSNDRRAFRVRRSSSPSAPRGAVAQLEERLVRNEEVGGSSPLSSTLAGCEDICLCPRSRTATRLVLSLRPRQLPPHPASPRRGDRRLYVEDVP